jgi:hypothetical protein
MCHVPDFRQYNYYEWKKQHIKDSEANFGAIFQKKNEAKKINTIFAPRKFEVMAR